jgi:hypothetical protein
LLYWLGHDFATELAIAFTVLQAVGLFMVMKMARSIVK